MPAKEQAQKLQVNDTLDALDDFLSDESDGHRLAEFLMLKNGGPRSRVGLFDLEIPKFNLLLQLNPVKPATAIEATKGVTHSAATVNTPLKECVLNNEINADDEHGQHKAMKDCGIQLISDENNAVERDNIAQSNGGAISSTRVVNSSGIGSSAITPSLNGVVVAVVDKGKNSLVTSPTSRSPRLQRRSIGATSDGLRRTAIRRSTQGLGRRRLLPDFEYTTNFSPIGASTPATITQNESEPDQSRTPLQEVEPILQPDSIAKNCAVVFNNSSCNSDRLMRDLQKRDQELRELLQLTLEQSMEQQCNASSHTLSITSRPSTPASKKERTYTLEKGTIPGQVVLTPIKNEPKSIATNLLQFNTKPVVRLCRTTYSQQHEHPRTPNRLLSDNTLIAATPTKPVTPHQNSDDVAEAYIPETQDQAPETTLNNSAAQLVQSLKVEISPMPIYQTSQNTAPAPTNQTSSMHNDQSFSQPNQKILTSQTNQIPPTHINQSTSQPLPATALPQNISQRSQHSKTLEIENQCADVTVHMLTNKSIQTSIENKTQMITDDETENEQIQTICTASAPLDLAPSGENTTRRRLRKRLSIRRQHKFNHSQTSDAEEEQPNSSQRILNLRRRNADPKGTIDRFSRIHPPLNKAPNTPINGEKFAKELERLTNYEILDLRIRNSMGKVFPLNGRKSTLNMEKALENQLDLDQHLKREISRRNLNVNDVTNDEIPSQLSPPLEFHDSQRSEMLTFRAPTTIKQRARRFRTGSREMSQEMIQYLDLANTLGKRKKESGASKRSLYTKGNSDTEEDILLSPEKQPKLQADVENEISASGRMIQNNTQYTPRQLRTSMRESCRTPNRNEVETPSVSCTFAKINEEQLAIIEDEIEIVKSPPVHVQENISQIQIVPAPPPRLSMLLQASNTTAVAPSEFKRKKSLRPAASHSVSHSMLADIQEALLSPPADYASCDSTVKNTTVQNKGKKSVSLNDVLPEPMDPVEIGLADIYPPDFMEALRVNTPTPPPIPVVCSSKHKNKSQASRKAVKETSNNEVETAVAHSTISTPPQPKTIDDACEQASTSNASKAPSSSADVNQQQFSTENDVAVFKKPTQPAPRRHAKKSVVFKNSEQDTSTLRRSKRGPVPRQFNAFIQDMYQKTMEKTLQNAIKRNEIRKSNSMRSQSHIHSRPVCTSTPNTIPQSFEPLSTNVAKNKGKSKHKKNSNKEQQMQLTWGLEPLIETDVPDQTVDGPTEVDDDEGPTTSTAAAAKATKATKTTNDKDVDVAKSKSTTVKKHDGKKKHKKSQPKKDPLEMPSHEMEDETEQNHGLHSSKNSSSTTTQMPINDMNTIFDQLKAASLCKEQTEQGKSKRIAAESAEDGVASNDNQSSGSSTNNSTETTVSKPNGQSPDNQVVAWLKSICQMEPNSLNNEIFTNMRKSYLTNLTFTDLEGIDYAFYNTEQKASIGYMRFKPKQKRPPKRAKTFNLHFVGYSGEFLVGTVNSDASRPERTTLKAGDMVAINKGSKYIIENTLDDISILMVIKQ